MPRADGRKDVATSTRTLRQRAYREIKEFLAIVFYLWVVFALFEIHKSLILREHHIDVAAHSFALINALALAKVMLVARKLHLGEFWHHKPLIYPTLLKSAIFTLLLACFKILEDAAVGWYRGQSFHQSMADIGGGSHNGILSMAAIMFVVLIPFFAFTELQAITGEGRLIQAFFFQHQTLELPSRSLDAAGPSLEREDAGKGSRA